VVLNYHTWFY